MTNADDQLRRRLRALFAEELDEGLRTLAEALLDMERNAGALPPRELVQDLFRVAHSLKGAAHAAGIGSAVTICSRLEDALAAVRDSAEPPDAAAVTSLLTDADELAAVAGSLRQGDPPAPTAASVPAQHRMPPRTGPVEDVVRVRVEKLDELLMQAGTALAAARRLHDPLVQAEQAASAVEAAQHRLRCAVPAAAAGATVEDAAELRRLLKEAARALHACTRGLETAEHVLHHAGRGLTAAAQQLRTQPFSVACAALDRAVRDTATATGKKARLIVSGADVEVDRGVVTALRELLLHLVRNAVDHGIEPPDKRLEVGKSAVGTVEVTARLDATLLEVVVRDDGRGLDVAALRRAAAQQGVPLTTGDADLAFTPGLSTSGEVTAVSGRGVGLDAARAAAERIGGRIRLSSRAGHGTEVHISLPVFLALRRILLVRAGTQVVALPTADVERVVEVERAALDQRSGRAELRLHDRTIAAVRLGEVLGFVAGREDTPLGVVLPRGLQVALLCEGLLDETEALVEPVPDRLRNVAGLLGVAVLDSGAPTLVIAPAAVAHAGSTR